MSATRPRLLLAGLLALALAAGAAAAGAGEPPPEIVTVYLVRHAEKGTPMQAPGDRPDPGLTAADRARAAELARALADEPVSHLFSTPLRRTRDTLEPLARATGLAVTEIREVREQAAALGDLPPGSVAVVSGHSNTVPALVAALGGEVSGTEPFPDGPRLPDEQHDRLLVLLLSKDGTGQIRLLRLLQLRYGAP